jgi:hypothetical protein
MINVELIESRKSILITELQNLQERLTELDKEKITLLANINAMRGALQQCDYFLGVLNTEEEEKVVEKKEKNNG